MAMLMLGMLIPLALIVAGCDRGPRLPGQSWFDIVHETNRGTRRRGR